MLESFELPAGKATHELEIKRSRFITWIDRAESEEAAREVIQAARSQYPDARHHCSAFIVRTDPGTPVERSSDDGEPSGTAGKPMLDALKGSGLTCVVAVVTRYFGGVKLGAGGLVHAYSESVTQTLQHVRRAKKRRRALATVDLPHAEAGRIESELRLAGVEVVKVSYSRAARYTLAVAPDGLEDLDELLASLTQGAKSISPAGTIWVERGID